MARAYIDENLGGQFTVYLRDAGHDALFAGDRGKGRTDTWHFREAMRENRVLLTLDRRDYQYYHRLWTTLNVMQLAEHPHSGILVAIQTREFSQLAWFQALQAKLAEPHQLRGRMLRWHPTQGWHEDDWKPEE